MCNWHVTVASEKDLVLFHTIQKRKLRFREKPWLQGKVELLFYPTSVDVTLSFRVAPLPAFWYCSYFLAECVLKWFLVLVTLWVNLYKQGFRGVKGEKGEPGQPGLDGLDAPCQLVQYFSFLPPCMQFLCLLHIHLYQCKVVLLEQALHDKHATCMCMNGSFGISAAWREQARPSKLTSWHCPHNWPHCRVCVLGEY